MPIIIQPLRQLTSARPFSMCGVFPAVVWIGRPMIRTATRLRRTSPRNPYGSYRKSFLRGCVEGNPLRATRATHAIRVGHPDEQQGLECSMERAIPERCARNARARTENSKEGGLARKKYGILGVGTERRVCTNDAATGDEAMSAYIRC